MTAKGRKQKREFTLQDLQVSKKLVEEVYPTTSRYPNKIGEAFKLYIYALIKNNKSVNTIKMYHSHVNEFISYLEENYKKIDQPSKIKSKHLEDFYDNCLSDKQNSLSTIQHKKITLSQFFNYLVECDLISASKKPIVENNVIKTKTRRKQKAPTYLDEFEIEEFFNVVINSHSRDKIKVIRDYNVFALMISTGLRINEALSLNLPQLIELREKGSIRIIGKGNKERTIVVSESAFTTGLLSKFDEYLEIRKSYECRIRNKKDKQALFISREGTRITDRSVQRAMKKYLEEMSLYKNITPHKLRHSFATALINAGVSLNVVADLLGHESIQTTNLYLHAVTKNLKEGVNNLPF